MDSLWEQGEIHFTVTKIATPPFPQVQVDIFCFPVAQSFAHCRCPFHDLKDVRAHMANLNVQGWARTLLLPQKEAPMLLFKQNGVCSYLMSLLMYHLY